MDFSGSLQFNPSKGTVDPQSLRADLNMDSVRISVDSLRSLLSLFEDHNQFEPLPSYGSPPSATADSAALSPSPNTPMSPFFEAFRSVRFSSYLLLRSRCLMDSVDYRHPGVPLPVLISRE